MLNPINPTGLTTLAEIIAYHAQNKPQQIAFTEASREVTWAQYEDTANRLAAVLMAVGIERGQVVAMLLPDGIDPHILVAACERAGIIAMALPARAGEKEAIHLITVSGASALVSLKEHKGMDTRMLFQKAQAQNENLRLHIINESHFSETALLDINAEQHSLQQPLTDQQLTQLRERRFLQDELFLLNSTSGTTGMPKCVTHNQSRWFYFADLVQKGSALSETDVFLSVIPAFVGFGIWTQHVVPTLLGAKLVLMSRFDAEETLRQIERHKVTMLSAVTTQFIMMLNHPNFEKYDLSSLRYLYTGGEVVPFQRAKEFEDRTGAFVLQFYGSNENGMLSQTTVHDSQEKRLSTSGRANPEMHVRLIDEQGNDATASGRGQPVCKGPAMGFGYYNNDEGNEKLFTEQGEMKTGDIVAMDKEGYLKVVGRVDDFIIRGGKNISSKAVEDAVILHPNIKMAAAIAMPDPVFGERVCVYVTLKNKQDMSREALTQFMLQQGVSKEYLPECLIVVESMPLSSGSKVAKHDLRKDIKRRVETGELPEKVAG